MKKSYFRHDYNARNDIKLQSVITKHGAVGIGVYWIIVEMLYQNGGELPLDIARNISVAYFTDFKVVESVINDFDLFENDGNVFWSVRIRQAIDNTKKVSDARKAASRQRWSRKQEKPENPESRKTASHPPGPTRTSRKSIRRFCLTRYPRMHFPSKRYCRGSYERYGTWEYFRTFLHRQVIGDYQRLA